MLRAVRTAGSCKGAKYITIRVRHRIPETIGTGRYIGDQIGLESSYRFSPQWEARMAAVHFRAGSALTQAGGKNVDFLMASLAFRW